MFLGVLDDLFGHDLTLETPQSAFNRFTLINRYYRHSISVTFFKSLAAVYLTRWKSVRSSRYLGFLCESSVFSVSLWCCSVQLPQRHREHRGFTDTGKTSHSRS